jgi:hypothetical protein
MGRELFGKGNEEMMTNPSKENKWGEKGKSRLRSLVPFGRWYRDPESEAVAAVTGVTGGLGRVGVGGGWGGGGSALTCTFGALVEGSVVQAVVARAAGEWGRVGFRGSVITVIGFRGSSLYIYHLTPLFVMGEAQLSVY